MKNMSGLRPTLAHIKEDTERARIWREVLGGTTAPIKSPVTTRVEIEGLGMQNVYLLDVGRLNKQQLGRLVAHLSTKFIASEDFVRAQLLMEGSVPILEEDVGVSFDGRLLV